MSEVVRSARAGAIAMGHEHPRAGAGCLLRSLDDGVMNMVMQYVYATP